MRAAVLVLLILLLLSSIALANFLYLTIKMFLSLKGVEVSFWRNDPIKTMNSLRKLIAAEQDLRTKRKYQRVLYLYIASIAVFLVIGLLFMFAPAK